MAKVLETVQRLRKVEEATAAREEPAPVYLLDEIVEIARCNPESAQSISEHIVKRLANKSPVVKFKALRLVKHMCLKGSPQFQRSMQRQSQAIRELVHYKGEPDPFKGDSPNQHVRELAKETIEVLFNATAAPPASTAPQAQGRIQGFGSSATPGSSISSASVPTFTQGKMVGFGNTNMPPPVNSGQQTMSNVLGSMGTMLKQATTSMGRPTAQNQARMFDSPPRESPPSSSNQWSAPPSYTAPSISATQVMGSEQQLVDDLCAPGGMRAAPLPEDLQRFVSSVGSMDGLVVGELLREKMESSSWQTVLRALYALEAVVVHGSSQACGEAAVMFQSDPTPLRGAVGSPQLAVREAAARVLKLLLDEDVQVAPAAPKKQVPKSYLANSRQPLPAGRGAAPSPNLLSLDDPAPASAPPRAAPSPDLLGGFSSPSLTSQPPAATEDSMFSGLTTDPAAPANSGPSTDLMFGGLSIADNSAPPAAPSQHRSPTPDLLHMGTPSPTPPSQARQASPAPAPTAAPLDDFFSDITAASAPAVTTTSIHPTAYQQAPPAPFQPTPSPNVLGATAPDLLGGPPASDLLGNPIAPLSQPPGATYLPGMAPSAAYPMQPPQQAPGYPPQMAYGLQQQPSAGQPGWQQGTPSIPPAAGYTPHMGTASYNPLQGMGAHGMPSLQQQTLNAAAAAAALQNQLHGGMPGAAARGGPPQQGAMRQNSWQGKDEVSNLMRHVATGGKHDPAFDFIKDELKPFK